jgi:hypothetical protein
LGKKGDETTMTPLHIPTQDPVFQENGHAQFHLISVVFTWFQLFPLPGHQENAPTQIKPNHFSPKLDKPVLWQDIINSRRRYLVSGPLIAEESCAEPCRPG